jgi:hypothetical protein
MSKRYNSTVIEIRIPPYTSINMSDITESINYNNNLVTISVTRAGKILIILPINTLLGKDIINMTFPYALDRNLKFSCLADVLVYDGDNFLYRKFEVPVSIRNSTIQIESIPFYRENTDVR